MKKIFKENYLYILIIIILIVLFYIIFNSNLMNSITMFDNKVIEYFDSIRNKNFIMILFTIIGSWYIPVLIILLLYFFNKNKKYSILLGLFYIIFGVVAYSCKYIVNRSRPEYALIKIPSSASFPSGHMLTSLCFYVLFAYILTLSKDRFYKISIIILFVLLSLLIGLSRIYLGVHYFSDVVGGLILGIPCLLMSINVIEKNYKEDLL